MIEDDIANDPELDQAFGEEKKISYSIYNNMNAADKVPIINRLITIGFGIIAVGALISVVLNLWF